MSKSKSRTASEPERAPLAPEHGHALPDHEHPHGHPLGDHEHEVGQHEHPLPEHIHPKHEHRDLRGHLQGAIRALLAVIETGSVNSEQRKAIHAVRVIIGDAHGSDCQHVNTVYEADDILVCQDCRQTI